VVFDFALREIKTIADQHPLSALRVSRIPPEQKKQFSEVLCVPVEYHRSKNQTGFSPGNSPLCGNPNTTGATLSGTPLLQRAVELCRRSLILSRYLQFPPLSEMALWRGAPAVYFHHAGENC
jgi:hypothetical protein